MIEKIHRSVQIDASTVEIEERGVKVRLTIVDTSGYGDSINGSDNHQTISDYIDHQFERYLMDESGLNRRNISDNRIHCLFYFISPFSRGFVLVIFLHLNVHFFSLKQLDIECMKALHHKVNIIPIIAKADALTAEELKQMKANVREIVPVMIFRDFSSIDSRTNPSTSYSNLSNTRLR